MNYILQPPALTSGSSVADADAVVDWLIGYAAAMSAKKGHASKRMAEIGLDPASLRAETTVLVSSRPVEDDSDEEFLAWMERALAGFLFFSHVAATEGDRGLKETSHQWMAAAAAAWGKRFAGWNKAADVQPTEVVLNIVDKSKSNG